MLVVSRRKGQRIVIGDDIEIVVSGISGSTVRLAIVAPRSVPVLRGEVRDAAGQGTDTTQARSLSGSSDDASTSPSSSNPRTVSAPPEIAQQPSEARATPSPAKSGEASHGEDVRAAAVGERAPSRSKRATKK